MTRGKGDGRESRDGKGKGKGKGHKGGDESMVWEKMPLVLLVLKTLLNCGSLGHSHFSQSSPGLQVIPQPEPTTEPGREWRPKTVVRVDADAIGRHCEVRGAHGSSIQAMVEA